MSWCSDFLRIIIANLKSLYCINCTFNPLITNARSFFITFSWSLLTYQFICLVNIIFLLLRIFVWISSCFLWEDLRGCFGTRHHQHAIVKFTKLLKSSLPVICKLYLQDSIIKDNLYYPLKIYRQPNNFLRPRISVFPSQFLPLAGVSTPLIHPISFFSFHYLKEQSEYARLIIN